MNTSTLASLPITEQTECVMQKVAEFHDLLDTILIEASINAASDQAEDRELVLERLPNGEYAWLRPDLTAKNRGPL